MKTTDEMRQSDNDSRLFYLPLSNGHAVLSLLSLLLLSVIDAAVETDDIDLYIIFSASLHPFAGSR